MSEKKDCTLVIDNETNYCDFEEFYVMVAIGKDNKEGLIAKGSLNVMGVMAVQPAVGGTLKDLKNMLNFGQEAANASGKKVKIVKYYTRTIEHEFLPQ